METLETAGIIIGAWFGTYASLIGSIWAYAVVRDWLRSRRSAVKEAK